MSKLSSSRESSSASALSTKVFNLVSSAFTSAQRTSSAHPRAITLLHSAHSLDSNLFFRHYTHNLNRILLIFTRHPHVERLIHFTSKAASSSPLLVPTLVYLLSLSNAAANAVRFRVVHLIAAILAAIDSDDALPDQLYDEICQCVVSRMSDRVARVRAAAVMAACRLQTTGITEEDPVAEILVSMCSDGSAAVRKAAVKSLAMVNGNWNVVRRRTRDINADVRKIAYEVLGVSVDPRVFPGNDRLNIVKEGLGDRDQAVRNVVRDKVLVEGWLAGMCEWDLVGLVGMLEGDDKEVVNIVKVVLQEEKGKELVETVTVDVNQLEREEVILLRALAEALKEKFAERFLPETGVYVDVLRYYVCREELCTGLLEICRWVDMADEVGRKELERFLVNEIITVKDLSEHLVEYAVRAMRTVALEEETTLRILGDVVQNHLLWNQEDGDDESVRENDDENGLGNEAEDSWRHRRALTVCREALRMCEQGKTTDSSSFSMCEGMLREAVVPRLTSEDEELRQVAMECVGLFCLLDCSGNEARMKLPLFLQAAQHDIPEIQDVAVKVIMDIMILFDLSDSTSKDEEEDNVDSRSRRTTSTLRRTSEMRRESMHSRKSVSIVEKCVGLLSENLTHADGIMRSLAAQGLARLIYMDRIKVTGTLLSRLLIIHHNPITEDDSELRQCLSVFFPAFATKSPANRLRLEDSFKMTIDVIMNAPSSSPLTKISVTQIAQFLLHLTNPAIAARKQDQGTDDVGRPADQIHERLAETVLHQLIDAIQADEITDCLTYGKLLSNFRLICNVNNVSQIMALRKLAQFAIEECDHKRLLTTLKRFKDRMQNAIEKSGVQVASKKLHASDPQGNVDSSSRETALTVPNDSESDGSERDDHVEEAVAETYRTRPSRLRARKVSYAEPVEEPSSEGEQNDGDGDQNDDCSSTGEDSHHGGEDGEDGDDTYPSSEE